MIKEHSPQCTGCTACYAICPAEAISMQPDIEGFAFPVINKERCTGCNKCDSVCMLNDTFRNAYHDYCYMAVNANDEELYASSSGGVFPVLARWTLSRKGIVCGCIFDKNNVARHVISDSPPAIRKMSKSKYVQSDLGNCYNDIKEILKSGRLVLFTGTPCQVSGLMNFLGKRHDNLVTMDFACHGVPSPKIFAKYLDDEKKKNPQIAKVYFRNKVNGWGKSCCVTQENASGDSLQVIPALRDWYYYNFSRCNILRKSCSQCEFCSPQRAGDFTAGDYWDIDTGSIFFNKNGVSILLANTPRALEWLKENDREFSVLERMPLKRVNQSAFWRPLFRGKERGKIFKELANDAK